MNRLQFFVCIAGESRVNWAKACVRQRTEKIDRFLQDWSTLLPCICAGGFAQHFGTIMRLSTFILANIEIILQEWEDFAATVAPIGHRIDRLTLRDHLKLMLETISLDLATPESEFDEIEKSQGRDNSPESEKTAASTHGRERLAQGFTLNAAMAEYRSLRASVTRLWQKSLDGAPLSFSMIEDLVRFNEAIDQSINESVTSYSFEKEQQMRIFDTILSSLPDVSFTLTLDGRLSYVNKAFIELFAVSASELLGKNFKELGLLNGAELQQQIAFVINTKKQFRGEMSYTGSSGKCGYYDYILVPALDHDGRVEAVAGTAHDITERKKMEDKNWQKANYDQLTGLPNRRLFIDRLEQEVKHAARIGARTALLFIDLDHFKQANDEFGHEAGDQLLRLVSSRLSSCIRNTDTVARLGGDEFTIILQDLTDTKYVEFVAREILTEIESPFQVFEHTVHVSASIGITLFPTDASTCESLLKNADQAMYNAKNAGRNQFSFYSPHWSRNAAPLKRYDGRSVL